MFTGGALRSCRLDSYQGQTVTIRVGFTAGAGSKPLLSKRRLNLAHFHLSDVATKLDSG
jgi:hypothetical protein